ncbi:putative inactive ribonuclease-like protein 13 [Camelus dromedarius]|uniref:Putative inactive ribonuclease-like protein 13 n=1 Tax=Camelus dromedarius TaxID=9838 RepID=A0A5N4E191_CAMDR|nr:putative inactive ribonuclease-like protein 13 [Camelus dromedarius]
MNQRRHQRKPKNLGTSGKEVGTKCSDDITEEETRKQCKKNPYHGPAAFQRLSFPAAVRQLWLVLAPTWVENIELQVAIENFRTLHIDYPRANYAKGFRGYCNGLMAYVRGRQQTWHCPKVHYVLHAPWKAIGKLCKYSESFCENYNEYCTLTQDSFPLTICKLNKGDTPTSCHYNGTLTNQRLYLLCSQQYDAEPMDIIGLY